PGGRPHGGTGLSPRRRCGVRRGGGGGRGDYAGARRRRPHDHHHASPQHPRGGPATGLCHRELGRRCRRSGFGMTGDLFGSLEAVGAGGLAGATRQGAGIPAGWPTRGTAENAIRVSEINSMAREILETAFPSLWIAGEVSGWKRHTSGHCYFTLRDELAQLRCVMFRADAQRLPTMPEEGMEVRVLGTLTLYERRGDLQCVVRELEGVGAGGLWRLAFERLRARLEAEGLLDPARKRPIPRHPRTVGIVTSPVGAALHDILRVIERRAPWTRIVLCPAKVQGDGAAEEIARAIELFGQTRAADVLIVGRGGGSVEDLWAFNEEVVARAIAASPIPIVSAVGHEVDYTIA